MISLLVRRIPIMLLLLSFTLGPEYLSAYGHPVSTQDLDSTEQITGTINVSGEWSGTVYPAEGSNILSIYFTMTLQQQGNSVSGTTRSDIISRPGDYAIAELVGTVSGTSFTFAEGRITEQHSSTNAKWCPSQGTVQYFLVSANVETLQGIVPAPGCGSGRVVLQRNRSAWPDLTALQAAYEAAKGTNEAGYVHQLLCIATVSCTDYQQNGTAGYASDFVLYLFQYLLGSGLPKSVTFKCPNWWSSDICFGVKGAIHGEGELKPAFISYCLTKKGLDEAKWDSDHDQFLQKAVTNCFDEVGAAGELSAAEIATDKILVPLEAVYLRNYAQFICEYSKYASQLSTRGLKAFAGPPTPPTPSKDTFFNNALDQSGQLRVTALSNFFLRVGANVQLQVTKSNADGTVSDLTSAATGTEYSLNVPSDVAIITPDGYLTVVGSPSALAAMPSHLYVIVRNGQDQGVGQLAIMDVDSDGDLLVDSYEKKMGLDPNLANNPTADTDHDGVSDVLEAAFDTNPTQSDSDNDGYVDQCEINSGSNPNDPDYIPAIPCLGPAIYIPPKCFSQTGQCIRGRFAQFWAENGGLMVFGYPTTAVAQARNRDDGKSYLTQWFERNRLELHLENPRPYDVLLGRLGADRLAQLGRNTQAFPKTTKQTGCLFFTQTQHNICGSILAAWKSSGLEIDGLAGKTEAESLALFGLPLDDVQTETLSNGKQYMVQWFERARFETHPENSPPYDILLGLLGNEVQANAKTP